MNNLAINKFRLSATNLYLTYPKCPAPLDLSLDILKDKLCRHIVTDYIFVKEFHEDSSPHIHAYLKCSKKVDIKNAASLDITFNDISYHGNYQTAKYPNKVISYMLKNVSSKSSPDLLFSPSLSNRIDLLGNWLDFGHAIIKLAEEGKVHEAIELYKQERPLDYLKNKSRIDKSLQELRMSKLGFHMKFDYSKFIVPEELKDVIDAYNENKTLVILGRPGIGKSS